eukprot:PLAT14760.1.p2 GENE.PLAT14760.1~~PLAT14760.1.p2  ORF type:complete len:1060 (-),score=639.07 PLAT14760.1:215-3394(-)
MSDSKIVPERFTLLPRAIDEFNVDQQTENNTKKLNELGGVDFLLERLLTTPDGLQAEEASEEALAERRLALGENVFPAAETDSFLKMLFDAFNDATLIVLIIAAIVSLIIGMTEHPETGWIEGTAILVAVCIAAGVAAVNDYSKEQKFQALNKLKEDIFVKVIREGRQKEVSTHDVVVGDIVELQTGDKIPADGVLLRGTDVASNESSLTGEPEDKKKTAERDPFLLSGCTLNTGSCRMIVIAVGSRSRWGRIKAKLNVDPEPTPLQKKLDHMVKLIGYVGVGSAILTMLAMIIVYFVSPPTDQTLSSYIVKTFIIGVTIIVVAVPEGLPLAVTISLAYSTGQMLEDKNLIRVLAACETMGNATNICSDKTGTLTENRMTVVQGQFGGARCKQGALPAATELSPGLLALLCEGIALNSNAQLRIGDNGKLEAIGSKTEGALLMMVERWWRSRGDGSGAAEAESKADESAAVTPPAGKPAAAGGADDDEDDDTTLLTENYLEFRNSQQDNVVKLYSFSSARKRMSVLVRLPDGRLRLYVKGASEIVLGLCQQQTLADGSEAELTEEDAEGMNGFILEMADNALRTIGIAHRDFPADWLPADGPPADAPEEELVLDAIVGIIDPLRGDVKEAVKTCVGAGITVRMVTGDNLHTACAIARDCGILTEGGVSLEGPEFRRMTPAELDAVLPKLQVLARSSPEDKHTLVTRLNGKGLPQNREQWEAEHPDLSWDTDRDTTLPGYLEEWSAVYSEGQVVGVTGDGTNDAPALRIADVGLAMGKSGTEVAKDASDIVILDDKFSSIVKAVLWGRAVYDNIRKFLQFQLTVNVVALALTFIAAVASFDPPLNAVMMLWVNLIMDTMGALALATEKPTMALLDRRPYKRSTSLISMPMWRNIMVQSLFQLILQLVLLWAGAGLFGVNEGGTCLQTGPPDEDGRELCIKRDHSHFTIMFNTFVFCQLFNEFNARGIRDEKNPFAGLFGNVIFMGVIVVTVVLQLLLVTFGGDFVQTVPLTFVQWLATIALGAISIPVGLLMRYIPVAERPESFAAGESAQAVAFAKAKL